MEEAATPAAESIADTAFVQDQQSLQTPLGVIMTVAMVVVALVLVGGLIFVLI